MNGDASLRAAARMILLYVLWAKDLLDCFVPFDLMGYVSIVWSISRWGCRW